MQQQHPGNNNFTVLQEQNFQYSLACSYDATSKSLSLSLQVPTDTFPKIYKKALFETTLNPELLFVYDNIENLYNHLRHKQNIQVNSNRGIVKIKYSLKIGNMEKHKFVELKLDRCIQNELDKIRSIIEEKVDDLGDFQYIQNRIEKLWKREEENEKIFMKFKEDIQFKVEQIGERMSIQNTKLSIIRQDVNRLLHSFEKLASIVCPMFSRINMKPDFTNHFILQDRKIMYVGESGTWTQILFKSEIPYRKTQYCFKIVNSKKNNIVAGICSPSHIHFRSSLHIGKGEKAERKFVGLSGLGQLYTNESSVHDQKSQSIHYHDHEIQKEKQRQKSKEKQYKSSYQLTISSPLTTSQKPSFLNLKFHHSNQVFKPMQIIKICVEIQKQKIVWKNGNKTLMEVRLGSQLKNQTMVPYFQFCDTGDSIQWIEA